MSKTILIIALASFLMTSCDFQKKKYMEQQKKNKQPRLKKTLTKPKEKATKKVMMMDTMMGMDGCSTV